MMVLATLENPRGLSLRDLVDVSPEIEQAKAEKTFQNSRSHRCRQLPVGDIQEQSGGVAVAQGQFGMLWRLAVSVHLFLV